MKVRGVVYNVVDGTFVTRKGTRVEQWKFQVMDDTAGLVACVCDKNGHLPEAKREITADVSEVRGFGFAPYYGCKLTNIVELAPIGAGPGAAPVPMPGNSSARK